MNSEYTTYKIALMLKNLGFKDDCLGVIYPDGEIITGSLSWSVIMANKDKESLKAPLWSQVLNWFRKEHSIYVDIITEFVNKTPYGYYYCINGTFKCGIYGSHIAAVEQSVLKVIEMISKTESLEKEENLKHTTCGVVR